MNIPIELATRPRNGIFPDTRSHCPLSCAPSKSPSLSLKEAPLFIVTSNSMNYHCLFFNVIEIESYSVYSFGSGFKTSFLDPSTNESVKV